MQEFRGNRKRDWKAEAKPPHMLDIPTQAFNESGVHISDRTAAAFQGEASISTDGHILSLSHVIPVS